MTIWEYHVEGLHGHHCNPAMTSLTDDLNRLGAEGWELVEGPKGGSPYHVFKRRKEVMPADATDRPDRQVDATPPVASEPQGAVSIMVDRVAGALRVACMNEFGTAWSWDAAWRFAEAALGAIDEPTREMLDAGVEIAKACGINIGLNQMWFIWREMLGRALK